MVTPVFYNLQLLLLTISWTSTGAIHCRRSSFCNSALYFAIPLLRQICLTKNGHPCTLCLKNCCVSSYSYESRIKLFKLFFVHYWRIWACLIDDWSNSYQTRWILSVKFFVKSYFRKWLVWSTLKALKFRTIWSYHFDIQRNLVT